MRKKFIPKLSVMLCFLLVVSAIPISPVKSTLTEAAATSDFTSSFEASDQQPTWENTSEVDSEGNKMTSGVIGEIPYDSIQGDITNKIEEISASNSNPPNEVATNLIDQSAQSKWLTFETSAWIEFSFAEPQNLVKYALTSANDAPGRDPKNWKLVGSNDRENWVELDSRTDQVFEDRYKRKVFEFENNDEYTYYRLKITENAGDSLTQLAEVALSNGIDVPPPPPSDMKTYVSDGPTSSYTAKTRVGWTGTKALTYEGRHEVDGEADRKSVV